MERDRGVCTAGGRLCTASGGGCTAGRGVCGAATLVCGVATLVCEAADFICEAANGVRGAAETPCGARKGGWIREFTGLITGFEALPGGGTAAFVAAEASLIVVEGRAEAFGQFNLDLPFGLDRPEQRGDDRS